MAQPQRQHDQYGDRDKGVISFSQPDDPPVVTMGSVDTVTIGEALEATALSLGEKPLDRKDAAAIQAAETRASGGESKTQSGGVLAAVAHAAASRNERIDLEEEAKVTIADILTDAAEKLQGDKAVTSEDAEAVVGAELRNSPEMTTTPGGVADSISCFILCHVLFFSYLYKIVYYVPTYHVEELENQVNVLNNR